MSKDGVCMSVDICLHTFVMNTCRLKLLLSSVYGGVGDMLSIATGNCFLDLTQYGRFF